MSRYSLEVPFSKTVEGKDVNLLIQYGHDVSNTDGLQTFSFKEHFYQHKEKGRESVFVSTLLLSLCKSGVRSNLNTTEIHKNPFEINRDDIIDGSLDFC